MRTTEEFHTLMQQVLTGSEEAAQELFRDYEPYLLKVIRRRLDKRMRSKFDSLDFAQDVWASFFAELPEKRSFASPEELVAFLTTLARNKVVDAVRRRVQTNKHDIDREQSLDDSRRFDKEKLPADQQTPSQIMMSQEEWPAFLSKLPLVYRQIFIMLREGITQEAIARELGLHPRTVNRIVMRNAPGGQT